MCKFSKDFWKTISLLFTKNLAACGYRHGGYKTFHIQDPKPRIISKATVRDRLVHHLVFKELYAVFDSDFFFHSYASREEKGTHLAVQNLSKCLRQVKQKLYSSGFRSQMRYPKIF